MRNYLKYRPLVLSLFKDFLCGNITTTELHDKLHDIQDELGFNKHRRGNYKCLWFKFTNDNTLCNTINNIICDTRSIKNGEYIRNMMQLAIDNPKDFKIYYS